jgi:hypothetical protein
MQFEYKKTGHQAGFFCFRFALLSQEATSVPPERIDYAAPHDSGSNHPLPKRNCPLPPSNTETSAPPPQASSFQQQLLKLVNEGKWWLAPVATVISVILLSKYLWTIGHPELLVASLGDVPNLLVWLLFATFGLMVILLLTAVPSFSLLLCMSLITSNREDEVVLAKRLMPVVLIGFLLLGGFLLASTYDLSAPPLLVFTGACLLSTALATWALAGNADVRRRFVNLGAGPIKPGRRKFYATLRILVAGIFLGFTAMTGVVPAEVSLGAWRGSETENEALKFIGICMVFMFLSMLPITAFYTMPGTVIKRLGTAAQVLAGVFLLSIFMLPALLDIWVFGGGNMMKLRDNRALPYLVDKADYPVATFDPTLWEVSKITDDDKFYTIKAFQQYRFGDVLLLCPGRYAGVQLKRIADYADKCWSTSVAKVKPASPRKEVIPSKALLAEEPNCTSVKTPTRPPQKIETGRTCLFQHPL